MKLIRIVFWLALGCAGAARAEVKLPALFSDHMVLQKDKPVPVWGWADPGEEVAVSLAGQTRVIKAGETGRWTVGMEALAEGENPLTLTVKGRTNSITVTDVWVGEVWLCSGQSNMGMTVARARNFPEEKAAATFPKIRMFRETSSPASTPRDQGTGAWVVCSPDTVGSFSATAYFFGRELHKNLGIPVGLLNSSVGGTPIEAWTSWPAQKDIPELAGLFEHWAQAQTQYDPVSARKKYDAQMAAWRTNIARAKTNADTAPRAPAKPVEPRLSPNHPASLFNGKIQPLIPYPIRGAIWYQGEANTRPGNRYDLQLTALIGDWRARWGYDFPFAWVQLPAYRALQTAPVEDSGWVQVREAMVKSLRIRNTGMIVALDCGEATNIHPVNKQEIGRRLSLWALAAVYGSKSVPYAAPLPASHEVKGREIIVSFDHADGGLLAKDGPLKGFAIAGADRKWVRATARIDGKTVALSSPDIGEPVAVRYAWADNPDCNLYNGAGLPASPFRTDSW